MITSFTQSRGLHSTKLIEKKQWWLYDYCIHIIKEDYTLIHFKSHLDFRTVSNYSISFLFHLMRIMIYKYVFNWRCFILSLSFQFCFVVLVSIVCLDASENSFQTGSGPLAEGEAAGAGKWTVMMVGRRFICTLVHPQPIFTGTWILICRFNLHSYHFLCLWRWDPIVKKFDTATVVAAGALFNRLHRNGTSCYVLDWSIWVEFSCCLPALIHSLVEEGATMQDNTDAPSQAFYKCHWLPGILL